MVGNANNSGTPPSGSGRSFQELKEAIAQDVLALEKPSHLITTLTYGVSLYSALQVCVEAGIFRRLAASSSPVSTSELARGLQLPSDDEDAYTREEFISRLLRGVCGLKLVDEAGAGIYLANELTRTLAHPGFEAGVMCMYRNLMGPQSTMSQMADWAKAHGYKAPDIATDGPLQRANNIVGTPTFSHWSRNDTASISHLNVWMQRIQQDRLNWSSWFPADAIFGNQSSEDGVFMVDVGGGLGHDLTAFAHRYPDRKMRLIVQDMREVIAEAKQQHLDARIELVEHDFFSPQPIKGAKIYFMHKIIHDWPDTQCVTILTQLRDAMSDDSRLFLNDAIIPDQGCPVLLAAFDFTMLTILSGKERSESMWTRLIAAVRGLTIRKFWQAPGLQGEGIVEVVKTA